MCLLSRTVARSADGAAFTDLFRAKWFSMIHEEWTISVLKNRPDLSPDLLKHTKELMDKHVAILSKS